LRRHIEGSYNVGKETAEILRLYISKSRFHTLNELMQNIKEIGKRLIKAQPTGKKNCD
jgi:translation initiation factor eIF-2B subunit beta